MRGRLLLGALFLACLLLAVGGWIVEGLRWAPRRVLARAVA